MIRFRKSVLINSILFALFLILGFHLDQYKTILNILNNITFIFILFFMLVAIITVIYTIIDDIYDYLARDKKRDSIFKNNRLINFIFYKHPFKSMVFVSLFISIIYLIFYYPGILSSIDSSSSVILKVIFNLGSYFVNDNFGIFLYVIIQVIINALIYGYILNIMNKIDSPLSLRIISLLFFGTFPYLNINSITYMNDVMYYLIFLFIFLYQYNHLEIEKDFNIKFGIKLFLLYIILIIYKDIGFYISIVSLVSLCILYINKKNMRYVKVLCILLTSITIFNTCYQIILPISNKEDNRLSISIQQIARYLNYYPDEVTLEEKKGILDIFNCDLDEIISNYNPYDSTNLLDKVKNNLTSSQIKEYKKSYSTLYKKHPKIYIDAILNHIYGYFYTTHRSFIDEDIGIYKQADNEDLYVYFNYKTYEGRNVLRSIADKLCHTKVVGVLYSCYFYVWLLIFITIYIIHRKYYELFMYEIPLFAIVIFSMISPINGNIRYLLPVMVTILPLYAIALSKNKPSNL